MMALLVVALLSCAAMATVAIRAERRFASAPSLPMQWGLSGAVNWWAPRRIALAFMPMLSMLLFGALLVVDHNLDPRPGQEGMVMPTFISLGLVLFAIQQLHLRWAARTVSR